LTDYASDEPKVLADLLMDADEKQFAVFYPLVEEHGEACTTEFQGEIGKEAGPKATTERQAKRQANAAVALARLDVEVDQLLAVDDRYPKLFGLGGVEQHAFH
jgi:hypothetical protein